MLRSIPCKLSGESLRNKSKLNFSLDFTDKAFPAKSVLPRPQAQIIERHDSYMRSLTTIVLVCILVAKAASGIRIPDWETYFTLCALFGIYYTRQPTAYIAM
ncbi:uncharacterized protein TRUGW13939_01017 [Talaromyces rugulosus]|uniref:Uncharacterized protein n=1 Tax=Talaromyces rugulosus TaxID=121627 RepID=A0A7H8QJ10_TALRU|nr:uncharacterized protein TRUGW13939_01017 [Talaromyces rugulosus]QKX53937.1 hypothetical protein TRUGW13939_01017 [Talaromyces rugulosus]